MSQAPIHPHACALVYANGQSAPAPSAGEAAARPWRRGGAALRHPRAGRWSAWGPGAWQQQRQSHSPPCPQAPQGQNLTEAQQEALLKAKYGGLLPKKKIAPKARPRPPTRAGGGGLLRAVGRTGGSRASRRAASGQAPAGRLSPASSCPPPLAQQRPTARRRAPLQDHKYFDSADWALSKQQQQPQPAGGPANGQQLAPKMEPSHFPPRRASQLGEGQ